MALNKRQQLIDIAQQLFYQQGIRITGIDLILARSGIAKKTLYNHFDSKEALILATLASRDEQFMMMMKDKVAEVLALHNTPSKVSPVLALFDAHDQWINSDNFYGCMFINASAEYPNPTDPIHLMCLQHKENIIQYINLLLPEETENKQSLALNLALLIDGAIVMAHTMNNKNAAKQAKEAAKILLA